MRTSTGTGRLARLMAVPLLIAAGCANSPGDGGGTGGATNTATIEVNGQVATATSPVGTTVATHADTTAPAPPDGFTYPLGAIDIVVAGVAPGSVVDITLALSTPVDTFRKLVDGRWQTFVNDIVTAGSLSADGKTITLRLQDGGRGDRDGVADGTIVDPVAPALATSLTITTDELPLRTSTQPYSVQLEAAGAQGPVTWSLTTTGPYPAPTAGSGTDLTASGLLTIAPDSWSTLFSVEADDGVSTARRMYVVMNDNGAQLSPPPSTAPLPDGVHLGVSRVYSCPGENNCGTWFGAYTTGGASIPLTSSNVLSLAGTPSSDGTSWVSPDGSLMSSSAALIDTSTGLTRVALDPPPTGSLRSFSPGSDQLLVADNITGLHQIYNTSDGHLVRSFTTDPSEQALLWSPVTAEVVALSGSGSVQIYSTTDSSGSSDRTVPIPSGCSGVYDWSITGRLALRCADNVTTISAQDGSDIRVVVSNACGGGRCDYIGGGLSHLMINQLVGLVKYSPNGQHLAMSAISWGGPAPAEMRIITSPDTPSAPLTIQVSDTAEGGHPWILGAWR